MKDLLPVELARVSRVEAKLFLHANERTQPENGKKNRMEKMAKCARRLAIFHTIFRESKKSSAQRPLGNNFSF